MTWESTKFLEQPREVKRTVLFLYNFIEDDSYNNKVVLSKKSEYFPLLQRGVKLSNISWLCIKH